MAGDPDRVKDYVYKLRFASREAAVRGASLANEARSAWVEIDATDVADPTAPAWLVKRPDRDHRSPYAPVEELPLRLAQIRHRLQHASDGPWNVDCHQHLARGCRCLSCHDDPTGWYLDTPTTLDCEDRVAKLMTEENNYEPKNDFGREVTSCEDGPFVSYDDASFAAHAREDVPWLLELVEKLMKVDGDGDG